MSTTPSLASSMASFHAILRQHWKSLAVFFLIVFTVQILNSLATFPSVQTWYPTLTLPSWTPPNWLFAPVWTILYLFLAIAGWLIWTNIAGDFQAKIKNRVMAFYFIQLALNALWSFLFFSLQNPVYGLIGITTLLLFATATMLFSERGGHKIAARLFLPYCFWVFYAAQLNFAIVLLNP